MTNYCRSVGWSLIVLAISLGCNTTQSPRQQVEDARITTEIKSKLAKEVSPSSLIDVKVDTTNGVVTLAGQVESTALKENIAEKAAAVRGVVDVNNNLQIEAKPVSGIR
jgi:hyperosmotically inducible periplasmic protein